MGRRLGPNSKASHDGDPQGLWLDDRDAPSPRRTLRHRRGTVAGAVATCAAAVAIPIGLVLATGGSAPVAAPTRHHHTPAGFSQGVAEHRVVAALSTTTDAGSFDFTYSLAGTPATNGAAGDGETPVAGSGIIDTSPTAMAASAALGPNGNGLNVGVRVDGTDYWETGYTDNQIEPQAQDGSGGGSSLSSFAGLVESSLGSRNGAVAMMGMASPTGYLDLTLPSIDGAKEVGTSTANGVDLTEYEVNLDPAQLASSPGTSPEEATTIQDALGVLNQHGYTGTTVEVGVDASGFIRSATSTATFSDGGTSVLSATFSNFGCAGQALMPGQSGPTTPPAGCVSPDTGVAPAVTTTTTTSSTVPAPTTEVPPGAVTTIPGPNGPGPTTTTTTTGPDSTTTPSSVATTTTSTASGT
ncbi:MAG TPA: hypothetical protein VG244_08660 [Acidimicrobiales bacterium]|nr:hypothetical protein [Acidimicrobiales bacterium]